MTHEFSLKIKIISILSLSILLSSFSHAQGRGGAIRFARLGTGRITLEGCKENPNESISCSGLGNPRGYTQEDLASLSGVSNKVGSVILGTGEAAVIIAGLIFSVPVGAAFSGAGAAAGGMSTGAAVVTIAIPTGLVVLVNKTIDSLNPARQWRKGSVKGLLSTHSADTSAVVFNSEKDYKKAIEITAEVLKGLPSNNTY